VAEAHESDGTMGRVAGTGSGAISGGVIGAVTAGPVGAVIGAIAGGALGAAAGEAAHHIGDDHDDVNIDTGSDGEVGRVSGSAVGGLSGAVVGGTAAGPVGAVVGAAAGGMLGAEAGDIAKDVGDNRDNVFAPLPDEEPMADRTDSFASADALLPGIPGAMMGIPGGGVGPVVAVPIPEYDADTNDPHLGERDNPDYNPRLFDENEEDTRGVMERLADAATGDRIDDKTGRVVDDGTRRDI
jgi:hypothetical protein